MKWISFWTFRLSLFFHPQVVRPLPIQTPDEIYTIPRIVQFERKFATLSDANITDTLFTQSYDEYCKHVSQTKDNDLECQWRQRLLMEFTPRGLVIMYYDAFKRGFAYYSDTYLPYAILNVVAMKYVTTYQCRALFVDEDYFPKGHTSPILVFEQTVEPKKDKGVQEGPFWQRKKQTENETPKKELCKNRFVNLGKLVNCQLLPRAKQPPVRTTIAASSTQTEYKFWKKSSESLISASQVFDAIKQ